MSLWALFKIPFWSSWADLSLAPPSKKGREIIIFFYQFFTTQVYSRKFVDQLTRCFLQIFVLHSKFSTRCHSTGLDILVEPQQHTVRVSANPMGVLSWTFPNSGQHPPFSRRWEHFSKIGSRGTTSIWITRGTTRTDFWVASLKNSFFSRTSRDSQSDRYIPVNYLYYFFKFP
jgi:hypothetical protein